MRRNHARFRVLSPALTALLALSACSDRTDDAAGTVKVRVATPEATPSPTAAATVTARATAAPPPPSMPNPQLTRSAFKDPPLPPELVDDGALKPLPPRPSATASGNTQ